MTRSYIIIFYNKLKWSESIYLKLKDPINLFFIKDNLDCQLRELIYILMGSPSYDLWKYQAEIKFDSSNTQY